ncbi:hypothetical protein BsWGS_13714 [Bradybaena similaris]
MSRDSLHGYGNTDHWTKLKVRANSFRDIQSADVHKRSSSSEFGQLPILNTNRSLENRINVFSDDLLSVVVPKSGIQRHWFNNCYQRRAREGFRYWLINRPTPTSYGRYGFGSYKMVLGIGTAPRT